MWHMQSIVVNENEISHLHCVWVRCNQGNGSLRSGCVHRGFAATPALHPALCPSGTSLIIHVFHLVFFQFIVYLEVDPLLWPEYYPWTINLEDVCCWMLIIKKCYMFLCLNNRSSWVLLVFFPLISPHLVQDTAYDPTRPLWWLRDATQNVNLIFISSSKVRTQRARLWCRWAKKDQ